MSSNPSDLSCAITASLVSVKNTLTDTLPFIFSRLGSSFRAWSRDSRAIAAFAAGAGGGGAAIWREGTPPTIPPMTPSCKPCRRNGVRPGSGVHRRIGFVAEDTFVAHTFRQFYRYVNAPGLTAFRDDRFFYRDEGGVRRHKPVIEAEFSDLLARVGLIG